MIGSAGRQKVDRPECINRILSTIVLVGYVASAIGRPLGAMSARIIRTHDTGSARPHRQKPPYLLYIPSNSLFLGWKNGSEPACLPVLRMSLAEFHFVIEQPLLKKKCRH